MIKQKKEALKKQTKIKNFTIKSTELLAIPEIIGIEHKSGKYSKTSIDALKEQVDNVEIAKEKLSLGSGKEVKGLSENIEKDLTKFKSEVSKLEKIVKALKMVKLLSDLNLLLLETLHTN